MNDRHLFPHDPQDPYPPAHHNAPPGTSDESAGLIHERTPALRDRVMRAFTEAGAEGLTDQEGAAKTGIPSDTYRPRRRELVKARRVLDSGEKRPTASGRNAAVWIASDAARARTAHAPITTPRSTQGPASDAPEGDAA